MDEKCMIGLDYHGTEPEQVMGSVMVSMIVIKPDFFRKYSWLKLQNLDRLAINKVFDNTRQRLIEFRTKPIEPKFMPETEMKDLLMVSMIEALNSSYQFWKNSKIYLHNFCEDVESFEELFEKFLPGNLRKVNLHLDKWHIGDGGQKICQLANIYARYHSSVEHSEIKSIWGDFGSGLKDDPLTIELLKEHPECPHIRKLVGGGTK